MSAAATLTAPAPCTCGAELPWHLVALSDARAAFTHYCRCGWSWRATSPMTLARVDATGRIVEAGPAPAPLDEDVRELIAAGHTIGAEQLYQFRTGCTTDEARAAVDAAKQEKGYRVVKKGDRKTSGPGGGCIG